MHALAKEEEEKRQEVEAQKVEVDIPPPRLIRKPTLYERNEERKRKDDSYHRYVYERDYREGFYKRKRILESRDPGRKEISEYELEHGFNLPLPDEPKYFYTNDVGPHKEYNLCN